MRKIRIAQIGINLHSHAPIIFATLTKFPEVFEIVGYALVEDERETCKHLLKAFDGYKELTLEEILSDPTIEAVTVETDEIHLNKYAIMAVNAGKHVHMEKPGTQDLASFEELIRCVKEKKNAFSIGYMYRYNPFVKDAIERARRGELGDIVSVEAQMGVLQSRDIRKWFVNFKGGMMFYLGCHLVDLVVRILGVPDEIIPLNCSADPDGLGTEDFAMAVFRYRNGTSFVRVNGRDIGGFYRRQLVVSGTEGTIDIKPLELFDDGVVNPNMQVEKVEYFGSSHLVKGEKSRSEIFDRYADMLKAFAACVRGEQENPYTPDYELTVFKVMLKCCGVDVDYKN